MTSTVTFKQSYPDYDAKIFVTAYTKVEIDNSIIITEPKTSMCDPKAPVAVIMSITKLSHRILVVKYEDEWWHAADSTIDPRGYRLVSKEEDKEFTNILDTIFVDALSQVD